MSRLLCFAAIMLLMISPLSGADEKWDHYAAFALEKDRWQIIDIHEGDRLHTLKFRWTLFKNGALVMHVEYDKHRYQPLLYKKFRLDSFKIDIFTKRDDLPRTAMVNPYAIIIFKAFDSGKSVAHIDLAIKDYGMSEIFYTEGKK